MLCLASYSAVWSCLQLGIASSQVSLIIGVVWPIKKDQYFELLLGTDAEFSADSSDVFIFPLRKILTKLRYNKATESGRQPKTCILNNGR